MPNFFSGLFKPSKTQQKQSPYKEIGTTGISVFGSGYAIGREKNPKLIGWLKYTHYEDILANVSIIGAAFRLRNNLIAKPNWSFEPVDESPEAEAAKEFAERLVDEQGGNWQTFVRHAGMFRFMGAAVLEWTARRADDGAILIHSIEPRPMRTIQRFDVDQEGSVTGFWQNTNYGEEFFIPRWKTIWLVDDQVGGDIDGFGLLRHCFEPSQRLKNFLELETIGYEKDFRGIPIGKAPLSAINAAVQNGDIEETDAKAALKALEDLVTMTRKQGSTGAIIDSAVYEGTGSSGDGRMISAVPQWGVDTLKGDTKGQSEIANAIERINYEIARILSAESLLLGSSNVGSQALANTKSDSLHQQINSDLKDIASFFKEDLFKPFFRLNGIDENLVPNIVVEEVSNRDAEAAAKTLKEMAAAGATFAPNDPIFNEMRSDMGYSRQPEEQIAEMEAAELAAQDAEANALIERMALNGNAGN